MLFGADSSKAVLTDLEGAEQVISSVENTGVRYLSDVRKE